MKTKQTNIRLPIALREWYDDLGKREERDAAFFMRKALEEYRDSRDGKVVPKLPEVVKPKAKATRFCAPSIDEVISYFREKGDSNPVGQGEAFFNFYESKGWLVGKSKMKSWKASVSGWMSRNKVSNNYGSQKSNIDSQQELLKRFSGGAIDEGVVSDQ